MWFVKAVLTTEQIWDISQGVKTTDATYGWYTCDIRVTYKYIRDGWHTSTYEWHIGGVRVNMDDIRANLSDIGMTYESHTSDIRMTCKIILIYIDIWGIYKDIRMTYEWPTNGM